MCEVTWNTWGTCERSWCPCMSLHALKILRFHSLSFCCVFLDRCTHTAAQVAQVWVLFTPSSFSCFVRVLSVSSDLFDLSIHLISYLFISLIFLLFLLPYTLYFLDVVDNKPAHFRWGAGPPGQKKLLHTSCHTPEGKKEKWIDALRRSSDRPTMENCKDQNGTITYIRAIQGQSRGAKINPFYFLWQGYRWIGKNTHSTRAALPTTNQS